MEDLSRIADPSLYNSDLAPVPPHGRTWGAYNFASLWIGMSVCIPTYMLASGLIAGGMSWWQAIGTILLGNLIVLIPLLLNGHAGTQYGIPFPVLARASFGVRGANIRRSPRPGRLRLVRHSNLDRRSGDLHNAWDHLACSCPGSQAALWMCFFGFWAINVYVGWKGIQFIRSR